MSEERNRVALTRDAEGSEVGDIGTVVHVYADCKVFEVDFMTLESQDAVIATVKALAVRPVISREITHSRNLTRAN